MIQHTQNFKYKNVGISFFHFVIIHAFDRRTDGQDGLRTDTSLMAKTTALHTGMQTRGKNGVPTYWLPMATFLRIVDINKLKGEIVCLCLKCDSS